MKTIKEILVRKTDFENLTERVVVKCSSTSLISVTLYGVTTPTFHIMDGYQCLFLVR
jgi:hypothetical protein